MAPQDLPSETPPPLPRPTDEAEWRERLDYWREHLVDSINQLPATRVIGGVLVGLIATIIAVVALRPSNSGPPLEEALPLLNPAAVVAPTAAPPGPLVVHVAGSVMLPGLVEVAAGSRVADAITAAGGPTDEADLNRINLALPLADADRVYVPTEDELGLPTDPLGGGIEDTQTGPLDLNRATATQLENLPGVGPATAAAIIAHRDANGAFASVTALESVPGIGPAKMTRLRDLVTVGQ